MNEEYLGASVTELPEWRHYIRQLAPLAEQVAALARGPHDDQWQKELYQWLYSQISVGYLFMTSDPKYPEFMPYYNHVYRQGFPNPDDTASEAIIEDGGIYRVSGFRGDARMVTFQLTGDVGSVARMIDNPAQLTGESKGVFNLDSASIAGDGSFNVVLSPKRPPGYVGDWWKLEPGATALIIRQRHYDWLNEADGRFAIERLDVPAARPRPSGDDIDAALKKVSKYILAYATMTFDGPNRRLRNGAKNMMTTVDHADQPASLAGTAFIEGMFELARDEALIIETELPGKCTYWGFNLVDDFWQSIDWVNRQSSLNGFTARLDNDGKLRMVVCAEDPAVPNWLDTVDRTTGFIYGRWSDASNYPDLVTKKVKFADLCQYLPAETPIITPEEREAAIRLRRKGVQLRRRW